MSEAKLPDLDHPVHELIARRWSPCIFDEKPVAEPDLLALFEAARWAPSARNEQPWRFIVATKDDPGEFARLLSCLVEGNQVWAQHAPVLALALVSLNYSRNGKPNASARHDLGLAAAQLTVEATSRGLSVHQMGGILPDRARELYAIPDDYEAVTGLAIGYAGAAVGDFAARDLAPRSRRPLAEFVFAGAFGKSFRSLK